MLMISNIAGVIADDLTGANDTALQFHLKGANTQILLCDEIEPVNIRDTQTWAISTESRNVTSGEAYERVQCAMRMFVEKINPDYFYKKIDSTLRGNIAIEIAAMLEILCWDAAVVVPAFPAECRITVGGYHLLKGIPVERTEIARDPHSPARESHLPTLLKKQLPDDCADLIGAVELSTVMKGAGPILMKINELVEKGKKIIVVDAVSTVDIEQIALAINKTESKILPAGAAAFAQALSELWFADLENQHISKTVPKLPKLIVSGSATQITAAQIDKLDSCDEFENTLMINLDLKTILGGVKEELVERVTLNLGHSNIVVVNTSHLIINYNGFGDEYADAELTKADLAGVITDFLAELTRRVIEKKQLILITLGGETSYKCCNAIGAYQLRLVDEVLPAIALSMDYNSRRIVTKSGNLGGVNTLIDILKYFERHEE
ncbi:MAG: four-carbon acid sugar kinase family protein [Heliobacteriaceae bacterium]|jgi:uncharacterized protein YgbK (DUF1537 family)|nr:four-carbon acid sugar kinase family protein [Heliobacteriaceae bacterium]